MANLILRLNEGDATVDLYAPLLRSGKNANIITVSGGLVSIGTLRGGDTLFILGHGTTSDLGGYSAADLAKLLADAGLQSGIGIILVACNSGTGGAPFALELKVQLVNHKILPSGVSGGTNTMYVTATGEPTTFWTKSDGTWGHTTGGSSTVNTLWGPRKVQTTPSYRTS